MRHARTPKFQLSGPTVHSLYCAMSQYKLCSHEEQTLVITWLDFDPLDVYITEVQYLSGKCVAINLYH